MSNSERDFAYAARHQGAADQSRSGASELKDLLTVIADQIAQADRRHTGVLHDMKDRLEVLGEDTRTVRTQLSGELAPAFQRIEEALSHLTGRVGDRAADRDHHRMMEDTAHTFELAEPQPEGSRPAHPSLNPPFALKSAVSAPEPPVPARGPEPPRPAAVPSGIDTFDIVDASLPMSASPWDDEQAEALTRILEQESESFAPRTFEPERTEPAPSMAQTRRHQPLPMYDEPAVTRPAPPTCDVERTWLEERFADIAHRLEQSLMDVRPDRSIDALSERFDQLEYQVGQALQGVATRADVEGLRIVEAHITELADHLDHAHAQLNRLDGIEAQINVVIDQLSVQATTQPAAIPATPVADLERLAERAAEEVALRIAKSDQPKDSYEHLSDIRSLLEAFITESRQGEEQTASMLESMQQALVDVLDRVDSMEAGQRPGAPVSPPVSLPGMVSGPDWSQMPPAAPLSHTEPASRAPIDPIIPAGLNEGLAQTPPVMHPEIGRGPRPAVVEQAPSFVEALPAYPPAGAPMPGPMPSNQRPSVETLRAEFIADAQRAKMRAAAEQAANPDIKTSGRPAKKDKSAEQSGASEPGNVFGISPRLLVAALAIVVAFMGGSLLFSRHGAKRTEVEPPAAITIPTKPAKPKAENKQSAVEPSRNGASPSVPASEGAPRPHSDLRGEMVPSDAYLGQAATAVLGGFDFDTDASDDTPASSNGDIIDMAPAGVHVQTSEHLPNASDFLQIQQQQRMASLSHHVAATAVETMTPAAYLTNERAASPQNPITSQPSADGQRTGLLDLPPATVGPLSLRLAAAKGDPSAQFEVAARLAEGKGTNQNFREAMRWYQRSAAQGFVQAQYRLGTLYERGLGAKADVGHARAWYQRAAEKGSVKAMHNLAVLSAARDSGSPDYDTAARWFRMAAESDLQDSQYNLAVLYESGLGVEKDLKQAYVWYALAARGGDKEASRRRDAAKLQLPPQDLADASVAAETFAPKPLDPMANDARVAGEDWKKRANGDEHG